MNIKLMYTQPILTTQEVSKVLNQGYSACRNKVLEIRKKHKRYYESHEISKASILSKHLAEYLDIPDDVYLKDVHALLMAAN